MDTFMEEGRLPKEVIEMVSRRKKKTR